MISSLNDLQRNFISHIRGEDSRAILNDVFSGRIRVSDGLRIYSHAYGARLRESLEQQHPVLGGYLGDALWDRMCDDYARKHPSHYKSLRDYGTDLPAFLAVEFRKNPEISELAAFERLLLDCFDAPDAVRADWDQLLALDESEWPHLRIGLHPSVRLHITARNSVEMWQAIRSDRTPPSPSNVRASWLLWRDSNRITQFRSLDEAEGAAMSYCLAAGDFVGLCDHLLAWNEAENVPTIALSYLSRWCIDGLVSDWTIQADRD